ncbi:MAG: PASTA domain-containing protein [Candidatus Velthaea sp.]
MVVWFGRAVNDFFGPSEQSVLIPSLVGQTLTDAQAEATRLRLTVQVIANQPSDQFPRDVVMQQQPAAGSRVREGRQLSLIVSTGSTIFAMPDLRFVSLREALLDLDRAKLSLAKTTVVPNDDVPAQHVLAQDPPPLASVHEGIKVGLTVSKGPSASLRVPNFVGQAIDDARADAVRAKTHLGQIVWTPLGPGGPSRGIVVRQKPDPGTTIDPFATVSLQVSAGPTEYGYLVRQVHATATIPATYQSANVRLEVRDQTGTWNLYNGYAQGGQRLDFNLTAIGTSELDTYINNELLDQTKLGEEPPRTGATPEAKKT